MAIINSIRLNNFSAFSALEWHNLGQLNVIIGVNNTGKTQLLKLLYSVTRSMEEYAKRQAKKLPLEPGEVPGPFMHIKAKLISTFSPKPLQLKSLIFNGQTTAEVEISLKHECSVDFGLFDNSFQCGFDGYIEALQDIQSTYIPPKEIFSIFDAIVETREGTKELESFDDTYYDLVRDFRLPTAKEDTLINEYFNRFDPITRGGKIEYTDGQLWYVHKNERHGMHQIAEGIRKISIFDRLIRNHRIKLDNSGSVLFLDEPETSLHPQGIMLFAEMLHDLAKAGVQVFLTTHSYFFLKRLEQLSKEYSTDYTLLDLRRNKLEQIESKQTLLKDGLSDNPIIEQSLRLYEEDMDLILRKNSNDYL